MRASLQKQISEYIKYGNLEQIKELNISTEFIDVPLNYTDNFYTSDDFSKTPFVVITNPTLLVYSILCEKPEIVEYFLFEKNANPLKYVDKWAPIHFAAATSDHRSLIILLRMKIVQENIDIPIIDEKENNGLFSTALHVAVTNGRYYQTILLSNSLPGVIEDNTLKDYSLADISDNQPANPLQLSSNGNSVLHIAAYKNDWEMIQILLNVCPDLEIKNTKGKTAIDVARENGHEQLVENMLKFEFDDIDYFLKKYSKKNDKKKRYSKARKKKLIKNIAAMTETVQQLLKRVEELENETA